MTFEIEITDGRWTVNGKSINELTFFEKTILNNFFQELKTQSPQTYDQPHSYGANCRVRSSTVRNS